MFHVVKNQLNIYILVLPDILAYVTAALSSITYIEHAANASKSILFPQLFEEIKTTM